MVHIPLRNCIVCRVKKNKADLVPITRLASGKVAVGEKVDGRSVYLCSRACLEKLEKGKRDLISHFLKVKIDQKEVFEKIGKCF